MRRMFSSRALDVRLFNKFSLNGSNQTLVWSSDLTIQTGHPDRIFKIIWTTIYNLKKFYDIEILKKIRYWNFKNMYDIEI